MKQNVRYCKDEKTGIEVTITQHENKYGVKIAIPVEAFDEIDPITTDNKQFGLVVTKKRESLPRKKFYVIELNRGYCMSRYGLIKNAKAVLNFETKQCFGSITLKPKFFIPNQRRATPKNQKKAREEQMAVARMHTVPKPPASKYTPYTCNNIAKPYSGGRVSPK